MGKYYVYSYQDKAMEHAAVDALKITRRMDILALKTNILAMLKVSGVTSKKAAIEKALDAGGFWGVLYQGKVRRSSKL